jgi:hypothetical protein
MPRVIQDSPLTLVFHTTYTIFRFQHYLPAMQRLLVGWSGVRIGGKEGDTCFLP